MKLYTLLLASFLSTASFAQTFLSSPKGLNNSNPLSAFQFCADPTAVEYNGRVYVYGTNDQQQFDEGTGFKTEAQGGVGNDYGKINSLVCMSSADLVNWTWHKPIEVKQIAKWTGCSWAPSICSREEADGQTHFYLYFANGASGIGVLTSTSPTGPWKDPLGKAMIPWGMKGMGDITWLFDPGVVVDKDGTGWLAWGGGGGVHQNNVAKGANEMLDMNTRIAKLNPDMISIAPENITILPAPYHFEASELNIIGGKFVYTYCSDWSGDRSKWGEFNYYDHSKAKPSAPGTAQMCYMVSTDPLNADSWQYVGMYGKNPSNFGYPGGNNHTHLQKFLNNYYLFYHCHNTEGSLKPSSDAKGGYRNIQVNAIEVNEATAKISEISMSNGGSLLRNNRIKLTDKNQAETMYNNSAGTGFYYNDDVVAVHFKEPGSWVGVRSVTSDVYVKSFKAKLRGKGKLEVHLGDGKTINPEPIATIEFSSTRRLEEFSTTLTEPIKSSGYLYFVCTEVSNTATYFDEWQFFEDDITAISSAQSSEKVVKEEYFNLSGVRCEEPANGTYILKRTFADGTTDTEKIVK